MNLKKPIVTEIAHRPSGTWTQVQTIGNHKRPRPTVRAAATIKKVVSDLWGDLDLFVSSSVSSGRAKNGCHGECNEEMFRYLLASESKRSQRSGCTFQVLLVSLFAEGGLLLPLEDNVAGSLFATLRRCLRGTDYIGWYQDRLVVGAVLTALGDKQLIEVSRQVEERIIEVSWECLSVDDFNNLQLRVIQHHELVSGRVGLESMRSNS